MEEYYEQFTFLVTEILDESLLLIKNAWGWTLQDILYPIYFDHTIFFSTHIDNILNELIM